MHVIPTPVARGAQVEARAIVDRLDCESREHRLLSLCALPDGVRVDEIVSDRAAGKVPANGSQGESRPSNGRAAYKQGSGLQPGLVLELRAALRRLRPSLVVAHGGDPLKYLVASGSRRRRPLAYYAIGTLTRPACHGGRRALWKGFVARADVVACEGEEVLEECRRVLGVASDRLVLAPNGRDPEKFRPRVPGASTNAPSVITFVGSLSPGKRPDVFVKVVKGLRERGLEFDATMIGDGSMRDTLRAPAEAAGVRMLGSRDDVADLLRASDVMIFPSRPQGEGMPGVLIEAGLSGVPVVATAVPGVRSIVAHGETGLVVDVNDVDSLMESTACLLQDPARREKMGRRARDRCMERFTLDAVEANWTSFLTPLLDRNGQ
ncbi:MAG TPA: glycosyltransferase family 4 protein [Acidimicrobiales bacterium]|nr:glycosyltransferase family 4 protein [Acidimicrobiales bacterium]